MSDFREELINDVELRADLERTMAPIAFMNEMGDRMAAAEVIEDLKLAHFRGTVGRRNAGVDGYDLGDTDDSVALAITKYDGTREGGVLTKTDVTGLFGQLEAFAQDAALGTFAHDREPSDPAVQLAIDIRNRGRSITSFRFYLFSDLPLGARFSQVADAEIAGIPVHFHVWDLNRLQELAASTYGRTELDLDLREWEPRGIPALEVPGDEGFRTFLAALPGGLLADLYQRHGSRLLESNVRAFLSGRGKINSGIKKTILTEPDLFLAYNNGITATASAVERNGAGNIVGLTDLQIVNGGQTTASLFYVRRDASPKPDLSRVFVQMKLVVAGAETSLDFVPNVARFANSQNRLSEADFFSNSPFHQRLENLSKRVLVPVVGSSHFQTKWFYERTRGQYQNEIAKLTPAEQRKFKAVYPKAQVMTKTDAAKYSVAWDQAPHRVSAGAQKNFVAFAHIAQKKWDNDESSINGMYFRELVAKAILFKEIRLAVAASDWYQQGYLANIVAYTIAKLSYEIGVQGHGESLDFNWIWNRQTVPAAVLKAAVAIARICFDVLTSEARPVQNVTEWAKRAQCWDVVKAAPYTLPPAVRDHLVSDRVRKEATRDARAVQKIDSGIETATAVYAITRDEWAMIRTFLAENRLLSPSDSQIMALMTGPMPKVPTDRQAARLLALKKRAEDNGYV